MTPQSGFGFSTGFWRAFTLRQFCVVKLCYLRSSGGYPPMWRQDVMMIVILLVISSAFAILLAVGEFIG
jgi:hypothetical protein